jgi:hypothetical protein
MTSNDTPVVSCRHLDTNFSGHFIASDPTRIVQRCYCRQADRQTDRLALRFLPRLLDILASEYYLKS